MTSAEINVMFIGMIIVAVSLIGYCVEKYLRRWWIWFVPILALLVFGLFYSVIYLIDIRDGLLSDPLLFNLYNQIMRGGVYLIFIAYAVVFIAVQKKVNGDKNG